MDTTFNYEIYFDSDFTDEESTLFCKLMEEAAADPKLVIWEAVGRNFVKGFVEYGFSGMDKFDAMEYFMKQINKLNYKLEISCS